VPRDGRRYAVAYSGGLDSAVLLAAMARLGLGDRCGPARRSRPARRIRPTGRGIAARRAAALGVRYLSVRVAVDRNAPAGLEAAAREARYAGARRPARERGDAADGASRGRSARDLAAAAAARHGVRGCAASAVRVLGRGYRGATAACLVAVTSSAQVADAWSLEWLEDPSNLDTLTTTATGCAPK
jgi:tRNA(Ile)-lysidine synthase